MDLFQNPSSLQSNRIQTAIWASKLVLMSMGIISTLVLFKVAIIPYTFHLVLSTLPHLWVSARSWLSLPFIYIIVNFIIITIAASSNFHHKTTTPFCDSPEPSDPKQQHTDTTTAISQTSTHPTEPENQSINETKEEEKEAEQEDQVKEIVEDFGLTFNKFVTDSSSLEKCTNDYFLLDSDDQKGDDDDTLEATWKAIMEGQGKNMKPQLKKSDTWGARITKAEPFQHNGKGGGGDDDDPVAWAQKELKKSETFNDRASLRREKSMSPEELNRRAEDFIKKFNNQMKLQRLESYQRFMDFVNRGV